MSPNNFAIVFLPDFLGPVMHILVIFGRLGSFLRKVLGRLRKALRLF